MNQLSPTAMNLIIETSCLYRDAVSQSHAFESFAKDHRAAGQDELAASAQKTADDLRSLAEEIGKTIQAVVNLSEKGLL